MTRPEALAKLLALPDEPQLLGLGGRLRGRRYTLARDPKRNPDELKRLLGVAYCEHRRQAWTNGDISCVVSVRRLRMVKRA